MDTGLVSMKFVACINLADGPALPAATKPPDEAAYGWQMKMTDVK